MERVDLKIGFKCNNQCRFCVQGNKRNYFAVKTKKEIKNSLKEAFKKGKKEVVFTGGEPTLHPLFLDVVRIAKKLGFKEIQIQTNGRMFSYYDFCVATIEAGATQFAPSLHGPNGHIHDFLTSTKGSFSQTVKGIKNLKRLNQYILTNTVITSTNFQHLPKLAKLLVGLGVNQYQFAFIHISGKAKENKDWIVPQKSKIIKYVKEGLDVGINAGKKVMTEAIPYCLMEGYEECVAERVMPISMVYDAGFVIEDYSTYRKNEAKAKGIECPKCKYYQICEGPWKEYPEIYGWEEFNPVKK